MKISPAAKVLLMIVIVLGAGLSLGLKFWADGQRLSIEGPSFLKVSPDNELAILMNRLLVFSTSYGETTAEIDFDRQGINAEGDFGFFSNGDLLVYHRDYQPGFLDNLARFLRLKELRKAAPLGRDGLYRCRVLASAGYPDNNPGNPGSKAIAKGLSCDRFTDELPAFNSSFRIVIDQQTDDVYIADTPRFKIYKLDSQGRLLAKMEEGLKFPNELMLENGKLYIANTNHHEVKAVETATERFGKTVNRYTASLDGTHRWPAQLAFTGDKWWVLIMNNGMSHGRVKIFDSNWQPTNEPPMPEAADPIGMVYFQANVYLADWTQYKIYRYEHSGTRLADFENKTIATRASYLREQQQYFQKLGYKALAAFIAVLLAGIAAAWILERKQTVDVLTGRQHLPEFDTSLEDLPEPPGKDIYWLESRYASKQKWFKVLAALLVVMLLASYGGVVLEEKKMPWQFHFILLGMVAMFVYMLQKTQQALAIRIGVRGKRLYIDNGKGRPVSGQGAEISYNQVAFVIEDEVALLGNPYKRLYDPEALEKWIIPRFEKGRVIGQLELFKRMWQSRHPVILMLTNVIGGMLLMLLVTKLAS